MRDFELDEPAGLVYCPFRALLHLPRGPTGGGSSSASPPRSAGRAFRLERVRVRHPMIAAGYADRLRRRPDGNTWE